MYKIRKIEFIDHPILKNLKLDFCNEYGKAVDTVIFAGENGTGKSTILECLYSIVSSNVKYCYQVEIETQSGLVMLSFYRREINGSTYLWVTDGQGMNTIPGPNEFTKKYNFSGIFSDVDINFHTRNISSVTSMNLDSDKMSRRSGNNLPDEVKQLLIDIQALDDSAVARAVEKNPEIPAGKLPVENRMQRFTNAFKQMFENLEYSRIDNKNGHKEILFRKYGNEISIDDLSSGEKQIVYRGCFLLKDANALDGAFVFIDEPEISLHPVWQQRIMDYYKEIFTSIEGIQTSQIFAVTHSPFIIHNDNRRNDKVIVLARNEKGDIVVKDRPEYFQCNSVETVQDAFSIYDFNDQKPEVYLEGRTDEKYFNKALQVFGCNPKFSFKWVGYQKENGQEAYTGKDSLNKAAQFLIGRKLPVKHVFLFDCDTRREEVCNNNVYILTMPIYQNSKKMKAGIENALILDDIDTSPFYKTKTKEGEYGGCSIIDEFQKMDFCDYICSLEDETLKKVFKNLKTEIDKITRIFEES